MERYIEVVRKAADQLGYDIKVYHEGYLLEIWEGEEKKLDVSFFDFDLNSSGVAKLVRDKSRCSRELDRLDIPYVEHLYIGSPGMYKGSYHLGDVHKLLDSEAFGKGIVLKDNFGGGGKSVKWVTDHFELDKEFFDMVMSNKRVCVSPFEELGIEYRVVVLNGEVEMMYGKEKGEDFKHNLSSGASVIEVKGGTYERVKGVAERSAKGLGLRFGCVDVVETEEGLKVLEVNGSVTLMRVAGDERFKDSSIEVYKKALKERLGAGRSVDMVHRF